MIKNRILQRLLFTLLLPCMWGVVATAQYATAPRFKVLAFVNEHVEDAHVTFAHNAVEYFKSMTVGNGFIFDVTADFADLNDEKLKNYDLVMMLNDIPHAPEQRQAFEQYMENGGGWMGFHVAAYNDKNTHWPWFVDFLGGGVFYCNSWPAMPARLEIDKSHPVTKNLPRSFVAPENEWYQWKPSPRDNKNVEVLLSFSPKNYPFGLKDLIPGGDLPVVWTHKKYRMIYLNMGHGGREFTDATQNLLFLNALKWVVATNKKGSPFN